MTVTLELTQNRKKWRIQTQANQQVSGALATKGGKAGAWPAIMSWGEVRRGEGQARRAGSNFLIKRCPQTSTVTGIF